MMQQVIYEQTWPALTAARLQTLRGLMAIEGSDYDDLITSGFHDALSEFDGPGGYLCRLLIDRTSVEIRLPKPANQTIEISGLLTTAVHTVGYRDPFGPETLQSLPYDAAIGGNRIRIREAEFEAIPAGSEIRITLSASGMAASLDELPRDLLRAISIRSLRLFEMRDQLVPSQGYSDQIISRAIRRYRQRPLVVGRA